MLIWAEYTGSVNIDRSKALCSERMTSWTTNVKFSGMFLHHIYEIHVEVFRVMDPQSYQNSN